MISIKKFELLFSVILLFVPAFLNKKEEKIKILIDPGHDNICDRGTSNNDVYEGVINLEVSNILYNILVDEGYEVYMTRYDEKPLTNPNNFNKREDLNNRIRIIKEVNPDIFVSIHQNYYQDPNYSGSQVFYCNNNYTNHLLALEIQKSLKLNLNNTNREIKSIDTLYMLRNISNTACLVECGFMSNLDELKLLKDKSYQTMLSYAIYKGIDNYINKNNRN